ncbi:hypothetical protein ACF1CY_003876 [Providencia rettgeri]
MKSEITQLFMIKATIIVATLFVTPNVQASIAGPSATYGSGAGFVWEGNISAIINVNQSGSSKSTSYPINAGLFAITLDTMNSCISSSMFATSSDGKAKGIRLADDVIFVLNGVAQGNVYRYDRSNTWAYINGRMNFNSLSASTSGSAITISGCPWDVGFSRSWSDGSDDIGYQPVNANISGKGLLYIGPKAKGGVVNFPEIYLMKGYVNSGYKYTTQVLISPSQFNILTHTCTISVPPTIDFGTVNLWNFAGNSTGSPGGARKDVLGVVDGNLSISCTNNSPEATAAAKLTLMGTIQTHSNDLKVIMDNTGNSAPATIRASIKNITSPCSITGVHFSTSAGDVNANKVRIDELGVGQTNIPYRFSLCSYPELGINQFGSASAQATIILDWD